MGKRKSFRMLRGMVDVTGTQVRIRSDENGVYVVTLTLPNGKTQLSAGTTMQSAIARAYAMWFHG